MGYCRVYDRHSVILRVACDGIHGMVSTSVHEYSAETFLECIALAKADGWLIAKGPEPLDERELSEAFCPSCVTWIDWDDYDIPDVF